MAKRENYFDKVNRLAGSAYLSEEIGRNPSEAEGIRKEIQKARKRWAIGLDGYEPNKEGTVSRRSSGGGRLPEEETEEEGRKIITYCDVTIFYLDENGETQKHQETFSDEEVCIDLPEEAYNKVKGYWHSAREVGIQFDVDSKNRIKIPPHRILKMTVRERGEEADERKTD